LGRDFPGFYHLLTEAIEEKRAKNMGCLAEEAEVSTPEDSIASLLAVQTRKQSRLESSMREEDDLATAISGAVPRELASLDGDLFGESRPSRVRLSRGQKRAQAEARSAISSTAILKTLAELTPCELQDAQAEDDSLSTLWKLAEKGEDSYGIRGQTLYHRSKDDWGNEVEQLVIPTKYRREVMVMAHNSPLSAHLGKKKTVKKIVKEFFWPGLSKDVGEHCKSCEQCQRGAKGNRQRAPLQPLPTMEEPFKRIAIDIVGPLRRTKKGSKYILTMMDFATRYPEAIPLRRIDATTVAEALCEVFARLGLPEEILSDQGSNFTSNLMKRVTELLQIHHLKTSPYHPQTDGMLERFHSTLKGMMRKTCRANKDWDEYLPFVCFAFRDSVHAATGFSPFQLLFGRDVRGPLSLLKCQLTGQISGSRPVVDFVRDLQAKLHTAWELAAQNDSQVKSKSKAYFDKRAKLRCFGIWDQVLVLSPSENEKFQAQWIGPYTVDEQVTDVTYRVSTPDKRKKSRLYHANSLKPWTTPTTVFTVRYCDEEMDASDGEPQLYPFGVGVEDQPHINDNLSEEQKRQLAELLEESASVFSTTPGHTDLAEHSIATGDATPVYQPPYRIPTVWQDQVRGEIQAMLDADVIEPSTSAWTSPIIPVKKKDGSLRLCIDYRKLNAVTQEDRYPMPRVEELLEQLGKAKYISHIDLTKGYYQVPVSKPDQEKTAFVAPMGKYQFKRMPFGLKGAPSTFQRLMDTVLEPCREYSRAYFDDIVVFSATWEEHMKHLKDVLQILDKTGIKAKAKKCYFGMEECSYLGHRVGGGKIKLEEAKVAAINTFKRPKTKRDVRAFLGLSGYYRRFIPGFADLAVNLSDLTKKDRPNSVVWSEELERDFVHLKQEMCHRPILACPDETKIFTLQTDASEKGIGAVLSQEDADGHERPIAFFSRKLLQRERNYSTIEKECLGIVAAIKHFDVHLVGRPFEIVTDHRALQYLNTMKNSNPRLTRWALAIQPFEFVIKHKPGSQHGNADGLSRQAWSEGDDGDDDLSMFQTICLAAEQGGRSVGTTPSPSHCP
jgi:transposase InsO family protein